jgi:Flp pilus assembly secretin CpaC
MVSKSAVRLSLEYTGRSVRSIVAAAGLVAGLAPAALGSEVATPSTLPGASAKERLDQAAMLLGDGRVVKARALLAELTTGQGPVQLSDAERTRANAMSQNAARQLKTLSSSDVSLQTAEHCLERGELRLALAQAKAVIASPKSTNEQVGIAQRVVASAEEQQARLLPTIAADLAKAELALETRNARDARALLESVVRSGVTLTPEQQARLDDAQTRVIAMGDASGASLAMGEGEPSIDASLGMMQDGAVRRRTQPTPPPPQPIPGEQPTDQPLAEQPAPEAQPAPASEPQPIAQPIAQPSGDLMAQARRWEAQGLMAEADFDFANNRLGDASAKYSRLLANYADQLTPEQRTQIEQRLGEARVRLGGNPGGNLLENVVQQNQAVRQSATAEFNNDLNEAARSLDRGDLQRARELAAQARVKVAAARNAFTNEDMEGFGRQVDDMLARIDSREAETRAAAISAQSEENRLRAEEAAEQQRMGKERAIGEAIARVRALQLERKYSEALQIVEGQILFRDPINPTGLLLRDVLSDSLLWQQAHDITRRKARSIVANELENAEAGILPADIIDFPADWPAISDRRGTPVAFTEAEENRRALATLQSKRIPVAFNDTPLENVIGFLSTVTQLNVDTDWQALENSGIDRGTTVTLNLTNVTVETVLNRIVEKLSPDRVTGAGWTISDGVLTVSSREQINKQRTLAIYDIRDLIIEVPDYDNAPEFDLQQALQARTRGGGGGGQSPFQDADDEEEERRTLQERTDEIIEIITTNVDPEGWKESGGDTGFIQPLNGLLIITNTPSNHRAVHGLLSKLREYRAMQINVETRFLIVSQNFFEQIGVDLDLYFNADSNTVRTARATRPTTRASDFFDPRTGRFTDTFPTTGTGAGTNRTPLASPWSPIGAGGNSLGLAELLTTGEFATNVLGVGPALGVGGQFLDDVQVDFLVKATQADQRTSSLQAPRLTFTNGQISNIFVATQTTYVSDLEPVVSESAVGFDPDPQVVNEGVVLTVDGTVSADRRFVTMNIDTAVARLEGFTPIPVTAIAGGQLVNSQAVNSFIQLPTTTVTRVQTTVTVPDQGTILLGGQRLNSESEVETGVPILSKIPILKRLFSNRTQSKEEQTLLILLKPTVLIQNELEEQSFPGLDDSLRIPF